MTYLHDVFNDVIDFQEEFEDICNSRRGHVSQEVGQEVTPGLEEVQYAQANYIVKAPVLNNIKYKYTAMSILTIDTYNINYLPLLGHYLRTT